MSNDPSAERQAARRRFGFSEDCLDVSTLLRARGPDGIACDRVADLAADETGRSIEHQQAKLALLFAKAGYEAWGLTADLRLADTAPEQSRLGFECTGIDVVSELFTDAETICERFGGEPPVLQGAARDWADPYIAKKAALAIRNWAGERLRELEAKAPEQGNDSPIPNDPAPKWPPDDGWHFRAGEAAFLGHRFPSSGKPNTLLQKLVTANRACRADDLAEEIADEPGAKRSRDTIRVHLSALRRLLREHFIVQGDPFPRVDHGKNLAWKFDPAAVRSKTV